MPVHSLTPRFLEKIWGSPHLAPWFPDTASQIGENATGTIGEKKIGEVWLESPTGEPLPLLIKFLFTTERLSVQVHPKDAYAQHHHQSPGKTEMWHILRAGPGAEIALGLREPLTAHELSEASQSGAVEQKLNWFEVHPGETYFVPAGTIHAIGAGVALCEIQQQSDVTYRLYDYGRPRELHLDHAIAVSDLTAYEAPPQSPGCLVESAYFRTERLVIDHDISIYTDSTRPSWLICLEGEGTIDATPYLPGQAWEIEKGTSEVSMNPTRRSVFLKTLVP